MSATPNSPDSITDAEMALIQHELATDRFAATSLSEFCPVIYAGLQETVARGLTAEGAEREAIKAGEDPKFAYVLMRAARHIRRQQTGGGK